MNTLQSIAMIYITLPFTAELIELFYPGKRNKAI